MLVLGGVTSAVDVRVPLTALVSLLTFDIKKQIYRYESSCLWTDLEM